MTTGGGRFDFDDGGVYIGGWQEGKAHGLGLCTGPQCQGEYAGEWIDGFESCGVYIWPSGNTYEGAWTKGKRHGEGVETKGRWIYKGEWGTGFKGRYGVRMAINTNAKYEGSWVTGVQDGFGVETYADGGSYSGQWMRGTRHGYGIRQSAPYFMATQYHGDQHHRGSMVSVRSSHDDGVDHSTTPGPPGSSQNKTEEARGGFVLTSRCEEAPGLRKVGFLEKRLHIKPAFLNKLRKPRSTGDITETSSVRNARKFRAGGSFRSNISDSSNACSLDDPMNRLTTGILAVEVVSPNTTEVYRGEWKNDKRSGFGICERSDGLRYEGEWYNSKKNGYGVTYFPNGTKDEGKYKNNCLIKACGKHKLFAIKISRTKEMVDRAVLQARQADELSKLKAEQAASRQAQARTRAELADQQGEWARYHATEARIVAKEIAPEFIQPGLDFIKKRDEEYAMLSGVSSQYSNTAAANKLNKPSRTNATSNYPGQNLTQQQQPYHKTSLNTPTTLNLPDTNATDTLQVSGGSRRGSFRSSFKSQPTPNATTTQQTGTTRPTSGQEQIIQPTMAQEQMISKNVASQNLQAARSNAVAKQQQRKEQQQTAAVPNQPLGKMLNSGVMHDHFDQYSHGNPANQRINNNYQQDQHKYGYSNTQQQNYQAQVHTMSPATTTDSGISDYSSSQTGSRRRTLPSVMTNSPIITSNNTSTPLDDMVRSEISLAPSTMTNKSGQTFIIENGIRKRVQAEQSMKFNQQGNEDLQSLPRTYRVESQVPLRKDLGEGSLPDVTMCKQIQQMGGGMTREQVMQLSQARRQELYKELERRRQGEIVIRLADIKTWCHRNLVVIIIFLINSVIAFLFVRLLSAAPTKQHR